MLKKQILINKPKINNVLLEEAMISNYEALNYYYDLKQYMCVEVFIYKLNTCMGLNFSFLKLI